MARNRRNKRKLNLIFETMSLKTFITLLVILVLIICICVANISYRNKKDKELLAKQREELEKNIEFLQLQIKT